MGNWLQNVIFGLRWFFGAIIGKPVPRSEKIISDAKYYVPTEEEAHAAINELARIKKENGLVAGSWVAESNDCDNFALHDYYHLLNIILPEVCTSEDARGKGFACGMFSYVTDGGARHRIAFLDSMGGMIYIRNYERDGTIIRELSDTERAVGFQIN